MTIRMLDAWNGMPAQSIQPNLGQVEEARLVGLRLASYDLDGPAVGADFVRSARDPLTGAFTGSLVDAGGIPPGLGATSGAVTALEQPAQYTINDGSRVSSAAGFQVRQPDGRNGWQVATAPFQAAAQACTVSWSAGNVATITVPGGHGCVESDAFVLQGATESDWWEVLRVATVTSATVLTARLPFTPAAGPTGTVTFTRCVRNVTVDIDLDYNFAANNTAGSNPNRMALVLAFLADSTIRVRGKNVFKYLVLAAGCDNCVFDAGSYPNANSDTFKLYGPSSNNTIRVFGQAPEDCVSLQALEPAGFIGYMPCQGNIRNTRVRGVSARITTAGSGAVGVYADPTYKITGTVIEDGESFALAGTGDGLSVKAGSGFTPTVANLADVTVRNMELGSAGGDSFGLRTPIGRLVFENVVLRAPGDLAKRGVYLNNDADVVEFNGCNFSVENWTPAAGNAFMRNVARAKTIRFNSCRIRGKAATTVLRFILMDGASSRCDSLEFNNCEMADMDLLCRFESTMAAAPQVTVNGGVFTNVLTLINFRKTGGRLILNGPSITGATNGVCRSEGASVISDVYGFANLATPAQLAAGISGGLVNLRTPNMPFAHTSAALNNADGNEFITNAAGGTLTAGMPVIGNGTLWLCRRDFTKTS